MTTSRLPRVTAVFEQVPLQHRIVLGGQWNDQVRGDRRVQGQRGRRLNGVSPENRLGRRPEISEIRQGSEPAPDTAKSGGEVAALGTILLQHNPSTVGL